VNGIRRSRAMTKIDDLKKIGWTMSLKKIRLTMSSARLPPLLARPDDDDRGAAPPLTEFSPAREIVLNDPGLLRDILAFVPDAFRLVAPVRQIFRRQYLAAHQDGSTRTLLLHATATPRTAQLWLDDGRPELPLAIMAARWARLDVLRYLHENGGPLTPGQNSCKAAASGGQLHYLEYALTNELAVWDMSMSNVAAQNGHLNVLRFAQARGYQMSGHELRLCARNGHLNVVIWLREKGYPWDARTCAEAARGSQLHVLQWLRANGCPWDARTCAEAAYGGQLHVLQWLRANGFPMDARICAEAARGGQLHVLQWARANGCPWNTWTCYYAALSGHLRILQWARANGCPWDAAQCLSGAVAFRKTEIVEWINGNGGL
jgi:hypothetical protein